MRVLVTGGGGFIGSSLAKALLAEGHEVRVLDSFVTGFREFVPDGCELIEGDLRDLDAVKLACAGVEIVYHQGAVRSVARSVDDPVMTDGCNVRGTLHVLVAAQEAGVRKVIYASSSSVYGDAGSNLGPNERLREDMHPDPVSPYGVSKLAGEQYCRAWTKLTGLPTVSLRYFNVYGPGQPRESLYALVFPAFIAALVAGEAPELHWDGEQSRDFTYIDDVIEANFKAAAAGDEASGRVFNVGAGATHTVNEVLKAVSGAAGVWIEPKRLPKRPGDVRRTFADITLAREILGWAPKAVWAPSVKATVDYFMAAAAKRT